METEYIVKGGKLEFSPDYLWYIQTKDRIERGIADAKIAFLREFRRREGRHATKHPKRVVVDGIEYPSIMAACRATKYSRSYIRKIQRSE